MTGPRIRIKEAIVVVCRILRTPMPEETPAPHRAFPDKRAARRSGTQGKRTDAGTSSHGRGAHLWIPAPGRSEEHTSELQSLMRTSYAVFRLKKHNISNN